VHAYHSIDDSIMWAILKEYLNPSAREMKQWLEK
jgi:uncharacterized protein with HEPN domain